jgi:hypothetical protein
MQIVSYRIVCPLVFTKSGLFLSVVLIWSGSCCVTIVPVLVCIKLAVCTVHIACCIHSLRACAHTTSWHIVQEIRLWKSAGSGLEAYTIN